MSEGTAAVLQVALLVAALAIVHRPLGDHMYRVFSSPRDLAVERGLYRIGGVVPRADQRWGVYARALLVFSAASLLLLFALMRLQAALPWSEGMPAVPSLGAWNTAVSYVTNTNWQWYSGEATMGYLVQMAGLAVQNFLSAAVGLAVAIALIRGFTRESTDRIGNFWVDLTRGVVRVLLPLAVIATVVLMLGGVVQNLTSTHDVTTLTGGTQAITGGPVASQEAIKNLGTNGGGFYNANSAHPFENPTAWTNLVEIFLLLVIPFSLPRTFGRLVGDRRQGNAVLAAMATLWLAFVAFASWAELAGSGVATQLAGGAMEGKETRFGEAASALFAVSTTGTSTGSVNAMHDSMTPWGGGTTLANMLLGEVSPGGVGAGLYGILVVAILTVFLAGLMVGRTPEYLGKKIERRDVTLVALYILVVPALVLVGAAATAGVDALVEASVLNPGPHGLSEVLYAYASASNNNGSAFAGFGANTDYQNVALGMAMLLGRFVPIVLVLGLAGSLAQRTRVPVSVGTLPTHGPLFVTLLVGVVLIVALLTFVPVLALSPIAEALS